MQTVAAEHTVSLSMTAATWEGTAAVAAVLGSRCLEEPAVCLHVAIRELIPGAGVLTGQVENVFCLAQQTALLIL